jgi:hypothetical protein
MKMKRSIAAIVLTALAAAGSASASTETKKVVAGPQYAKSGLHKMLFGKDYRALWTTPATFEVLDLEREVSVRPLPADGPPGDVTHRRVFDTQETEEIRLYALGGDDRITVTGREDGIKLRVIGGARALQATAAVNATVPTIGAVPVATEAGEPLSGRVSDVEQIA